MLNYYEPPCDYFHEYKKPQLIESKIQEICANITKKGDRTFYSEIFDLMYEHIENNLEKYIDGDCHEFHDQ